MNIWIDDTNDPYTIEFLEMIGSHHFKNHVTSGTVRSGHILDLVCNNGVLGKIVNLEIEPDFSTSPTHKMITYDVNIVNVLKTRNNIRFRNRANLDSEVLLHNCMNNINLQIQNTCTHYVILSECLNCSVELF